VIAHKNVDVTLWFALRGSASMPLTGDPGEFRGLRWVPIDRRAEWLDSCYAPDQVGRFLTKLAASIG
jgi:hypothetical protein